MITGTPNSKEFFRSGLNVLNLAWSISVDLVRELEDASLEDWDTDGIFAGRYWEASQSALGNAFVLVQQSQELALKGKIAEISPFLLIGRETRDWPKRSDKQDTPFAKFRTPDAVELIKIFNTVCDSASRLSDEFERFFEETRLARNAIIHVGSSSRKVEVADLLRAILSTYEYLYAGPAWAEQRRDYLSRDRISAAYSTDHVGYVTLKEFDIASRTMSSSDLRHFFGLTKARRYLCPQCHQEALDSGDIIPSAQLKPNTPSADRVACAVCGVETAVERRDCEQEGCKSNVICADPDWGPMCLTCGLEIGVP